MVYFIDCVPVDHDEVLLSLDCGKPSPVFKDKPVRGQRAHVFNPRLLSLNRWYFGRM